MNRFFHRLRNQNSDPAFRTLMLLGVEGMLLQFISSLNGFGHNLYATNMGATASEIGLINLVPNLVACVLLIPVGIIADRARSAKTMPMLSLIFVFAGYLLFGTVPALGSGRMVWFFVFLALLGGGLAVYNAQWQSFFGDVVPMNERNDAFAFRNRLMFVVSIVVPIVCGVLMGTQPASDGKLLVLRIFYYTCAALVLLQIWSIMKVPEGKKERQRAESFSLSDVAVVVRDLAHNRRFLLFFVPMVLFYMAWHMDWSMWYIGQVNYMLMTETQLAIYTAVYQIGQLYMIGVISRIVRKRSVDFAFNLVFIGQLSSPIVCILVPLLPEAARFFAFTALITISNGPQCAVSLCVVQLLLANAPEKNRALIVSLYTLVITLSNSLMPYLGVQLYEALGGNYAGFAGFYGTCVALRVGVMVLMLWRYRVLKRDGLLTKIA